MPKNTKRRSKSQRVRDRRKVAELYLEGRYQEDIGKALGLSQHTVSRDLRHILDQWQAEAVGDITRKKGIIEQRYLYIWQQAIAAWQVKKTPSLLAQAMTALKAIRELLGTDAVVRQEIAQVGEEIVINSDDMATAMKRLREKGYDEGEKADDPPAGWIDEIKTSDRP